MVKESFSSEYDQNDPKVFRETLGSFGTTTKPGENQLTELQTKVRQGVKHVELHMLNSGKGQWGKQDVPDKYGFEQRRTIMQLAKLNNQTLSVHGTLDVNSFSGLREGGFDETVRARNLKEIDETVKFAAEVAKGGAVVFHLHETAIPTPPGELNLPRKYLEKLKKDRPEEYNRIESTHLKTDNFQRLFQDNPELPVEKRVEYESLKKENSKEYKDFKERYKDELEKVGPENEWKIYYNRDYVEKLKNTDQSLVVVGNSLSKVDRNEKHINILDNKIQVKPGKGDLNPEEKEYLKSRGISNLNDMQYEDFQELRSILLNGNETQDSKKRVLNSLKSKLMWNYDEMLSSKQNMRYEADKSFFDLNKNEKLKQLELKKKDLKLKMARHKDVYDKIKEIESENQKKLRKFEELDSKDKLSEEEKALKGVITEEIANKNQQIYNLYSAIGQIDYNDLARYNELMANINEQISEIGKKTENTKVLTDEIFYKNASAMGHLGLKALRYQLDLKNKSESASDKVKELNSKLKSLEEKRDKSSNEEQRAKLNAEISKTKYELKDWIGVKDYSDINVKDKPLYLAPENIMAGYGYMDSLEEYKAVIRESWEEFAKKLMSKEGIYKKIREDYEKATGEKVDNEKKARELAKRHISGTYDNAHAGVWLKYFNRLEGESEEERIDRFNKWLNTEAESMVKEGIVKHIHFNDTQAKDDDHNLLVSGILDIHDWREKLRKAGVKEPLIVEAGGRGADSIMHILNAFDTFNPSLRPESVEQGRSYRLSSSSESGIGGSVSDWVSVKRTYENRPEYSQYGMSYNSFRHEPPKDLTSRGGWSGTGFL